MYVHIALQDMSYCAAQKIAHAATKDGSDGYSGQSNATWYT